MRRNGLAAAGGRAQAICRVGGVFGEGRVDRAGARNLDRSAGERFQTFWSFHFPRLNSTALHSASTENDTGTEMKTPIAPSPTISASSHASGTWPSQKQKKFRRVGVHVSPAPLNAPSKHMPAA